MIFDDRLETVLRTGVSGDEARRIQYRQLIDLLGRLHPARSLPERGLDRLADLEAQLGEADREGVLRASAPGLRHPALVTRLAAQSPAIAAAAIAVARLDDGQWADLIEALSLHARGCLGLRRDLGPRSRRVLARLGASDLALPSGNASTAAEHQPLAVAIPAACVTTPAAPSSAGDIQALRQRIEAHLQSRNAAPADHAADEAAALDGDTAGEFPRPFAIDFVAGPDGRITWAGQGCAPMLAGFRLEARTDMEAGPPRGRGDRQLADAVSRRAPMRAATVMLEGAPQIAGNWRIDAVPRLDPGTGEFLGYRGLLRRPAEGDGDDRQTDRLAQLRHELATPVNAIQGFAELIRLELFGPVPQPYRDLAASIAGRVGRLVSALDELEQTGEDATRQGACP